MDSTTTISHEIAQTLRGEILCQQYRSGERLPSERDLASRFGASRGAVREALSQLDQLGLIDVQPGGARVRAIDCASISILGPLMELGEVPDAALVDQFLQTFGALAALNSRESVLRANTEQLNRMQAMVVSLGKNCRDLEAMQPQWRELLEYQSAVADNLVVKLINNDLKAQFVDQMMKLGIKPVLKKKAVAEFLSSLSSALAARDSELAGVVMQNYFDELRQSVLVAIENRLAG